MTQNTQIQKTLIWTRWWQITQRAFLRGDQLSFN